jgi:hypothetical protein
MDRCRCVCLCLRSSRKTELDLSLFLYRSSAIRELKGSLNKPYLTQTLNRQVVKVLQAAGYSDSKISGGIPKNLK